MAVLKTPVLSEDQAQPDSTENSIHQTEKQPTKQPPPLLAKLTAILLISCISFGSHWYSSVTSAMKSTLKKVLSIKQYNEGVKILTVFEELHISNTQFSLLEASEDFMATVLLPFSGLITDRFGGASMFTLFLPLCSRSFVGRYDRIRQHNLHPRLDPGRRSSNSRIIQIHDWQSRNSCFWRYCDADRAV